ncbi:FAD-dependent oxidoreductase [Aurantimonas sp. A2-1-M11]|uniref:NAD(P)/FAD-dependent oxidoreductase n=1 Tax=Aurantimonas sp. A2-1-M11 TaxID=3113712 RepID=UPI002F947E1F
MAERPTRVLILGGGAGGLELAAKLAADRRCAVTLVDAVSTHLWKPRLHEFAAGTVNSTLAEISFYMLAGMRGFRFEQGSVEAIDRAGKTVRLAAIHDGDGRVVTRARSVAYDVCVVALGGITTDFGTEGVAEHAIRLDTKADADEFRELFIAAMIEAREGPDPARVVIIGSGATGTELAAHLRLSEQAFFEPADAGERRKLLELTILEAAPELMPGANAELRAGVSDRLRELDITVETGAKVAAVTADDVRTADGQRWPADIAVWAAGLVGHPCLEALADFTMDRKGRIVVDNRLRSTVDPAIYVLGDAASHTPRGAETPLPPTAQCASQQAEYLASAIPATIVGGTPDPFVFRDKGRLLSLGRAGSVGLIGFARRDDFYVAGQFATAAYHALQRQHQWAVLGPLRGTVAIVADVISPARGPALKLHG